MGDDCCLSCQRWGEREADPIEREGLAGVRRIELVVRGTAQVAELSAVRPEVSVGRASANDLVLRSGAISKRQARFLLVDGEVYAEDLGSACGTFVDGRKIRERTRLGRGAVVSFADFDVDVVER